MKLIQLRVVFAGFVICGFFVLQAFSQTNITESVTNPATVSGKIFVEGKAAANISIGIIKASAGWNDKPQATAKTDTDGKFSLENLPAGSYYLRPEIPGYVFPNEKDTESFGYEGKQIVLEAGENLENADLQLVRGAIITGRLTDSEGKPLISEQIRLETFNEKNEKTNARYDFYAAGQGMTDDRGVYRFYELKAGKYLVSFGLDAKKGGIVETDGITKKSYYSLIYYPSVQNEKDAKIVELNVGETSENIDLRTGKKSPAFTISGTLYDQETGKPFEKSQAYVGAIPGEDEASFGFANDSVKDDGSFTLKGFLPGKYLLETRFLNEAESEYFSPTTDVEITDK
ncbi:MAG: carboxypeptidase regulatory-like domain-containing protein, partial [Acidobacteriota bacterium]